MRVLGETLGKLVVDGYLGHNKVTLPVGREPAGCLAHLRRKFFEAQSTSPALAKIAMDRILDAYRVEGAGLDADLRGTPEHLEMHLTESAAVMEAFKAWLDLEEARPLPKSPIGQTIAYALVQRDTLTPFLTDQNLPVDNNASQPALRVAALGRKSFLFVGHYEADENLAGLYSLVATCEANDINSVDYLPDVLVRVQTQLATHIDALLPHRWVPWTPVDSS